MHRHSLDVVSLVFGVLFLIVGVPVLFGGSDPFLLDWSWGWPLLAIGLGVLLLFTSRRDRGGHDDM